MASEINVNLLSGRAFELKRERAVKAKVQFTAAFILVCFLGFLIVVFGISTVVTARINRIKTLAKAEEERIGQLAFLEDGYLLLQNKVALLEDYFDLEGDVLDAVEYLVQNIPEEIELTNFGLDNKTKAITLSLAAPSYEELNSFLDFAMSNIDQGVFTKFDFGGISRDADGKYSTKLILIYKA